MANGEEGNAIGKLCAGQATKIVWEDHSAEPFLVHWDGGMANQSRERKFVGILKLRVVKSEVAIMQCLFKPKQN